MTGEECGSRITITHTHAGGTLIEGSARGDGVYELLRGLGDNWRYFPSLRQIGLGQSRDKLAKTWVIDRAAEALRNAGHEVTVEIDETERRDVATIEAGRAERAGARAEHYSERAERRGAEANETYAKARQMAEAIPFGQPMMPDHHSYGRDRNYRARMGRTYDRAFEGMREAERLADRAEAAEATQAHRESIPATLRRIERLEAERRGVARDLTGRMDWVPDGSGGHDYRLVRPEGDYRARLEVRAADLDGQLAYWRQHVAAAEAGGVKVWTAADFTKGDFVLHHGRWYEVLRVNPKSLTLPGGVNFVHLTVVTKANVKNALGQPGWTDKLPYDRVTGRKSAAEAAAMLADGSGERPE